MRDVLRLSTVKDIDGSLNLVWRSPTGAEIIGTSESAPGTALVTFNDDGTWDHSGSTDIAWDGQETIEMAGETVWIDDDGHEWLESQLIKDPDAAIPDLVESPWDQEGKVRDLVHERLLKVFSVTGTHHSQLNTEQLARYAILINSMTHLVLGLRSKVSS